MKKVLLLLIILSSLRLSAQHDAALDLNGIFFIYIDDTSKYEMNFTEIDSSNRILSKGILQKVSVLYFIDSSEYLSDNLSVFNLSSPEQNEKRLKVNLKERHFYEDNKIVKSEFYKGIIYYYYSCHCGKTYEDKSNLGGPWPCGGNYVFLPNEIFYYNKEGQVIKREEYQNGLLTRVYTYEP